MDNRRKMDQELILKALKARENAYVPYSKFAVGAAVRTKSGEIFDGCNIENISYSATVCAERTAIFSAVSKGNRQFTRIAVAGGDEGKEPGDFCAPCGVCLQVMSEFCGPDFEILLVKSEKGVKRYTLKDLLPVVFDSLKR